MGYFLRSAPELNTPRAPHCPPFEGPVNGFTSVKDLWAKGSEMAGFKPKIEIVSNPVNIGKTAEMLLDLRCRWLKAFLDQVLSLNSEIPRDVAVKWVDNYMPRTADELAMSMTFGECEKLAFRLADAWEAI